MDFIKHIGKDFVKDFTGGSSRGPDETWYITAIRAEGLKKADRFTKSDPYLIVDFGGKSVHTRVIQNDLSPYWNETFTFKLPSNKVNDIYLKLKDQDIGIDDTIGTATVSRAEFPMYSGEEKTIQVPIRRHEQIRGMVHLRIKKVVEGAQSSYSQPPMQQYSQPPQYNYGPQQQQQQYPPPSYPQQPYQQPYPQQSYQQPPPSYQNTPYQQTPYQQPPPYGGQNYPPQQSQQSYYSHDVHPKQYPQHSSNQYSGSYQAGYRS